MLSQESKRELVRIAREAISRALEFRAASKTRTHDPALSVSGGAFVTLSIGSQLRGCIGYIESTLPLAEVVAEVAVKAALEDPRFPPLTRSEFQKTSIEVSILSPLDLVRDVEEIQVGIHGLLLELGSRRGLLLPQVATEYRWDRTAFLNATARKAGLPEDAWQRPDARIHRFSAEVIEEADLT